MAGSHSLEGLMKWLEREEWAGAFKDLLALHLGSACESAGIAIGDLASIIGVDRFMVLWACIFEDFLTRDLPDGSNIIDDYLKRRGWKEKVHNRAYIAALRSSTMSLYELSGIVPGESFLARDLVRGSEPVRISEKSGSRAARQWDKIGARVVPVGATTMIAGGVLIFGHEDADRLLESIQGFRSEEHKKIAKLTSGRPHPAANAAASEMSSESATLRHLSPLFTTMWLNSCLPQILDPKLPKMVNTEGDDLLFTTVRYSRRPGATDDAVRKVLRALPALREESPTFWNWAEDRRPVKHSPVEKSAHQTFVTTLEDGSLCLGTLELTADEIILTVNSKERAERGQAMLTDALAGLAREPLVEMQTVEQLMASKREGKTLPPSGHSPDDEKAIIHAGLDKHYHGLLDEQIGRAHV
jgi:hypothetical protein